MFDPFKLYDIFIDYYEDDVPDIIKIQRLISENNISLDQLIIELEKFKSITNKYDHLIYRFLTSIQHVKKLINPGGIILDSQLRLVKINSNIKYQVRLFERNNDMLLVIYYIKQDIDGDKTGIKDQIYYEPTPGQFYVSNILKSKHLDDTICIDGNSGWTLSGFSDLRKELIKKYPNLNESFKALKIFEML